MISKIKNLAHRQLQGEAGGVFRGMIALAMGAGLARIVGMEAFLFSRACIHQTITACLRSTLP